MSDDVIAPLADLEREVARIPPAALDAFLNRHSYSARLDAYHGVRSVFGGTASCSKANLFVLSGRDRTDVAGKAVPRIDTLLCGAKYEGLVERGDMFVLVRQPQVVATPVAAEPVLATARIHANTTHTPSAVVITLEEDVGPAEYLVDVTVEIATWNTDDTPKPRTEFSWICTVEGAQLRSFG